MKVKNFLEGTVWLKKGLYLALAVLSLLSAAACSRRAALENTETGDSGYIAPVKRENLAQSEEIGGIYRIEQLALPDSDITLFQAEFAGDKICLYGVDGNQRGVLYQYDPNQNAIAPLELAENYPPLQICGSWDDNLHILTVGETGDFILHTYAGTEERDSFAFPPGNSLSGDLIVAVTAVKNGYVVQTTNEVVLLNPDGTVAKSAGAYDRTAACTICDDGSFIIARTIEKPIAETVIEVYDENFNQLSSYHSEYLYTEFYKDNGQGNSILARSVNSVFRVSFGTDTREALIDCYSSGIYGSSLFALPDGKFFSIVRGMPVLLSRADRDNEDKTVTLAAYNLNYALDELIRRYNESNMEYKIQVIDYAMYNQTEDDGLGLRRLQTDIIAGVTPDIYDLSNLPAELYASKGLFEDLLPYLEDKGESLSEKIVPNVYETLLFEDRLYYITPSFSVMSLFGDASFVGSKGEWNAEEFLLAVSESNAREVFGPGMTRQAFISYMLLFNKNEFFDSDYGKCSFDNDVFKQFLEVAVCLPADVESMSSEDFSRVSVGEQKLVISWFGSRAFNMISYADAVCSGQAEFVGFPSNSSSGAAIVPTALVSVSSASKNKTAAVDFIKYLLSEGMQDDQSMPELPALSASFDKKVAGWLKRYSSAVSEERIVLNTIYDGQPYKIKGTSSPERVETCLYNLISSADTIALFDNTLYQIVLKECEPFFNGDISVEQAAVNIQSKASIYLAEQFN